MTGWVSVAIDGSPGHPLGTSLWLSGTCMEVLLELEALGAHDAVARFAGSDWMVTRGSRSGSMDIIRNGRRIAVLLVRAHVKGPGSMNGIAPPR